MDFIATELNDVWILEPKVFGDDRGYFYESFNQLEFDKAIGEKVNFCQDNQSLSNKGVVRGLHFQLPPYTQGKLVRVTQGSVLDAIVDLRKGSSTFGQHLTVILSAENKKQLWVPPGFAHGFATLEDQTIFQYKCTEFYHPSSEKSVLWSDEDLNIDWMVENALVSAKDEQGRKWKEFNSPF